MASDLLQLLEQIRCQSRPSRHAAVPSGVIGTAANEDVFTPLGANSRRFPLLMFWIGEQPNQLANKQLHPRAVPEQPHLKPVSGRRG